MKKIFLEACWDILDSMRVPITAKDRKSGIYPYYGANGLQDYVSDYIFDDELVLLSEDGGHFNSKEHPIAYRVSGKCWVNNHAHVLKPKSGIDVGYLCYTLMFYDVSKMINGTTRKKLNQSSMRKMLIPIVNYNEQLAIVYRLKIIENLIDNRHQQLNLLDELIKSRFIEMFGDPVINSMGWEIKKLSKISEYFNGLTYSPDNIVDDGIIVLRSSNIQNGILDFNDIVRVNSKIKEKIFVKNDDILMCSRNGSAKLVGKSCIIKDLQEPMTFGAFMMIIRSQYNKYLIQYLQLPAFRRQIKTAATTTINQITVKMLDNIILPLPPIELQNKFAAFVEQVEKSKETIKKSLDELNLLKNSLMQKYFG